MKHTVAILRKLGHKVRVSHWRNGIIEGYSSQRYYYGQVFARSNDLRDLDAEFLPHGGICEIELTLADGRSIQSTAECPHDQNYNRKLGVEIALEEALIGLGFDAEIPEAYPILKRIWSEGSSLTVLFTSKDAGVVLGNTGDFCEARWPVGTYSATSFGEAGFETVPITESFVISNSVQE